MKRLLPIILTTLTLLCSFAPPLSDDIQTALHRALGKRVELVLIECGIKPKSRYIVSRIEDGFCLFTKADTTKSSPDLDAITLPIERILTLRELTKDTFKLTAL